MSRRDRKRATARRKAAGPKPGTETIDLDLSTVPTVEQGIADAAERYKGFSEVAMAAHGKGLDRPLFEEHLSFASFINRACSLHKGVVSAVREANPHAAFTLLRAYLELVVIVYIDSNPDYIEALKRPISDLPPNTRKRFRELFEFAGREMAGVIATYDVLNEMAHFGSTALWHPFIVGDAEERRIAFSTAPGWKKADDARIALAMLQESDEAMAETLRRYSAHHILPHVERYEGRRRIVEALVSAGGTVVDDDSGEFTLPVKLVEESVAAGLIVFCERHQAPACRGHHTGVSGGVARGEAADQLGTRYARFGTGSAARPGCRHDPRDCGPRTRSIRPCAHPGFDGHRVVRRGGSRQPRVLRDVSARAPAGR